MDKQYETIIIPKGTLLFRSTNTTFDLVKDFAGIPTKDKFCLFPNFNVFFYPYPFVSESVKKYDYTCIFVLTTDVKLINLIEPSKYSRKDRLDNKGGVTSCDTVDFKGCTTYGKAYDPCIDFNVVKDKKVVGMLAIAQEDAKTLKKLLSLLENNNNNNNFSNYEGSKIKHREIYYNNYYKLYKDSRKLIGVPEIILYPRREIIHDNHTETINEFSEWLVDNDELLNYTLFYTVKGSDDLQMTMESLMSNEGFDLHGENYKVAINKETGFFQMINFTDNSVILERDNDLSKKHYEFKFTAANLDELESTDEINIAKQIKDWIDGKDVEEYLTLMNYNIKKIPANLPQNIKKLALDNNNIEDIENIPESVVELYIKNNQIKEIKNLPKHLKVLDIDNNKVASITSLPNTLFDLSMENNKISSIDNLPNSISRLNISKNTNIEVINKLPSSLEILLANECSIEYIKSFPKGLHTLFLIDNRLEELPNFPNKLTGAYLKGNPLKTLPTVPKSLVEIQYDEPYVPNINNI